MRMIPVSSSNLESVGYENGILCIAFHGGRIYEYTGVPESVYQGLMVLPRTVSISMLTFVTCIRIAALLNR